MRIITLKNCREELEKGGVIQRERLYSSEDKWKEYKLLKDVNIKLSNGDTIITNYIRINNTGGTLPSAGDFVMYFKNAQAESLGVMGHYTEITLTLPNTVTTASELFAIESEFMKSYP